MQVNVNLSTGCEESGALFTARFHEQNWSAVKASIHSCFKPAGQQRGGTEEHKNAHQSHLEAKAVTKIFKIVSVGPRKYTDLYLELKKNHLFQQRM